MQLDSVEVLLAEVRCITSLSFINQLYESGVTEVHDAALDLDYMPMYRM